VAGGEPAHLVEGSGIERGADAGVDEAALQGEQHGLGHAGVAHALGKAEVEAEVGAARDCDHAAVDHQHVGALLGDAAAGVGRA
jgi:hypothetical protein